MTLNLTDKLYLELSGTIRNQVESVIRSYPESGGIWYPGISGKVSGKKVYPVNPYPQVNFLWPVETLSWLETWLPIKSLTRLYPLNVLSFVRSTMMLPTGNNIQLLHDFEGNCGKYFSSGLVMFPAEDEKTISSGLIFQDRNLEATSNCKYQMIAKCIWGLIWAGLNSDFWTVFILQGLSRPARVPDPTQCIRVPHCFNFISGNHELLHGLVVPNRRKSRSDSY